MGRADDVGELRLPIRYVPEKSKGIRRDRKRSYSRFNLSAPKDAQYGLLPRCASPSQVQFLTGAFTCRAATVLVWLFALADVRPFFEILLACFT